MCRGTLWAARVQFGAAIAIPESMAAIGDLFPDKNRSQFIMAHAPSPFKKGVVTSLDPAVVKLIDALARSLAREDDARERAATEPIVPTRPVTTGERPQP